MQEVAWTTSQHRVSSAQTPYTGIQEQTSNMQYHNISSPTTPSALRNRYHDPNSPSESPPRSTSFPSSSYADPRFAYHTGRPLPAMGIPAATSSAHLDPYDTYAAVHQHAPSQLHPPTSFSISEQYEGEILRLRQKIQELESANESLRLEQKDLAGEAARVVAGPSHSHGSGNNLGQSAPRSAAFQASWKARTNARIRQFCSLNRAGNALCAWHDSRRERRAYPPRMAPPGYLNCGCTYEEALFEESLSRHGVGSYRPGESLVRMDPALRNPLLKLLEARYEYRDGDFERDINTGLWVEGEGPEIWDHNTPSNVRRSRDRQ